MKKAKILLTVLFVIIFAVAFSNISFATYCVERGQAGSIDYDGSNVTSTKQEDGSYLLKLTGDADEDLEIRAGDKVVLDLAGHKFTNFSTGCAAINVFVGGELKIIDSSEGQTGKIDQKAGSTGVVTIQNSGTLTIEAGTITGLDKGAFVGIVRNDGTLTMSGGTITGADECIRNVGTLTISGDATVKGTGDYYSVGNEGTLNITGGTITGSSTNTSVVGNIKRDGSTEPKLEMTDGTISGVATGIINRNGSLTVSGGEVESSGQSAINVVDGEATIEDGTFTSADGKDVIAKSSDATVIVEGGNFSSDVNFVAEGMTSYKKEDGTYIIGKLSVEVLSEKVELTVGNTLAIKDIIKATIVTDEESYDVTDKIILAISDENIAKIENGKLVAVTIGNTTLAYELEDEKGNIEITVKAVPTVDDGLDTTPKTGVIDVIGCVAIITILSAVGIIVLNKKH